MYGKNSTGQNVQLLNAASPLLLKQPVSPNRLPACRRVVPDITTASTSALYICPMAHEFGCVQTFTTSGHASRHARGHMGKKYAFCPECDKSFTRKDNMEQHRLTHSQLRKPRLRRLTRPTQDAEKVVPELNREDSVLGPISIAQIVKIEHAIAAES